MHSLWIKESTKGTGGTAGPVLHICEAEAGAESKK